MNVQSTERPDVLSPPPKKSSPAIPAIVGVVVLIGIGLFMKNRSANQSAQQAGQQRGPQIRTVKVVPVVTGKITEQITVTGILKANQNIDLNPKISDRVAAVYVKEGQHVQRGQLLVKLDDSDLREAVASARANLATQNVRLQQTIVGLPARVAQVGSNIENARAALATAKARYQQALLNEPVQVTTAQSGVETAKSGVDAAQSRLKQARDTARQTQQQVTAGISSAKSGLAQAQAQLEQVRNGSREQQVGQAQAQVKVAQAQLDDAQTNLNRQKQLFEGGATAKANVDTAQTQFEVARAQLESANQNLSLVREGSRTEEVRAAEEVVNQRQAALRQAQADQGNVLTAQQQVTQAISALSQSQDTLRQANANLAQIPITRQETRTAREAVNQADTALRQAIANRSQIPVAQQDVPAARAAVQTAQVQLNQALNQLSYTRIVSPINGVVNTKNTDVGESAAPGTPLFNLVSLDDVYFEAQIPESQLARIKVNQPADITVSAVSDKPVTGYVTDIIRVASDTLRQFRLRISLPRTEEFTPGAFARGLLTTQVITNTLTLPNEVIRLENNKNYVFVVVPSGDNAEVKRRNVTIGASANGVTQILSGVNEGDRVIGGNTLYEEGDKVRVAKDSDESGGSTSSGSSSDSSSTGSSSTGDSSSGGSATSSGSSGGSSTSSSSSNSR